MYYIFQSGDKRQMKCQEFRIKRKKKKKAMTVLTACQINQSTFGQNAIIRAKQHHGSVTEYFSGPGQLKTAVYLLYLKRTRINEGCGDPQMQGKKLVIVRETVRSCWYKRSIKMIYIFRGTCIPAAFVF